MVKRKTYHKFTYSTDLFYKKKGINGIPERMKKRPKNWKYVMDHAGLWV